MRKRLVNAVQHAATREHDVLDLDRLAQVEFTSEDAAHPVEAALLPGQGAGWRAAGPGEQIIRLLFAEPQQLTGVHLLFVETERERTQEFVLRWSPDGGISYQEIVRQQWNFSPQGAMREEEDYRVDLYGVTVLELKVTPDINGGAAHASLARLQLR